MAIDLTEKQRQCLDVIERLIAVKGYSPSYKEIAKELGVHYSYARAMALALRKKGYLQFVKQTSRSFTVLKGANW
jgi:SOS-response transcriptional repressor LexA